ncbi:hypothetical protein [Flavobacterium psychrophilum]|nr:hypothetical protein [Flavobacterium psychrophilum]
MTTSSINIPVFLKLNWYKTDYTILSVKIKDTNINLFSNNPSTS